ncbi:hypothetical protein PF005_g19098 [Phytophthora fragariae]|uniref:Class II aldolase/adducin N-terminal domain-containing protein n=3 Tax=Phytophthora fragariae TaxID=53985 RepID=A0A6A3WTL5_9STRA|nr:hypothetical protein PF005_g19098 [Phytophthora fragariae]
MNAELTNRDLRRMSRECGLAHAAGRRPKEVSCSAGIQGSDHRFTPAHGRPRRASAGKSGFRISHQEMIKGVTGHGYADMLTAPVIDNAPKESALAKPIARTMKAYPTTSVVLVRCHGLFCVWGGGLRGKVAASSNIRGSLKRVCSEKTDNGELSMAEKHKVVMCAIDGTATPITFVHDIMFLYVTNNVERFLQQTGDHPDTKADVAALVAKHKQFGVNPPALNAERGKEKFVTALTTYVK